MFIITLCGKYYRNWFTCAVERPDERQKKNQRHCDLFADFWAWSTWNVLSRTCKISVWGFFQVKTKSLSLSLVKMTSQHLRSIPSRYIKEMHLTLHQPPTRKYLFFNMSFFLLTSLFIFQFFSRIFLISVRHV